MRIMQAETLDEFNNLINRHEKLLSSFLEKEAIKSKRFPDFKGEAKSLGAWGGDFVLMTCSEGYHYLENYLKSKNLATFFSLDELMPKNFSMRDI
jgi:hypothetical protein